MTFSTVRHVAVDRLNETLVYLNFVQSLETPPGTPTSHEMKIMKGLLFVHLYGALEKITTEALEHLLRNIGSIKPENHHVTLPFNVVSMSKQWKSLKDSGYKDVFSRMTGFFLSIESDKYHGIEATLFSDQLQNIWGKTIEDVIATLGISGFSLSASERALVDEIVDKRNAVAHGRESAASIGERYRCEDLRRRLTGIQSLTSNFVDKLETYFQNREFIQVEERANYQ